MKKINILRTGNPSAQWQSWVQGLKASGFNISLLDRSELKSHGVTNLFGDAIVLDAMLPHLSRLIASIRSRNPDVPIIVASENDSFTVYYEVQYLEGAIYVSGPQSANGFASVIQRAVMQQAVA